MSDDLLGTKAVELIADVDNSHSYVESDIPLLVNQADVNFFESQMNPKLDSMSQSLISGGESLSHSLAQKKHDFEQALKVASESAKASDVLAAARSLSEYSIQTSIVAKAAGKSSQAVDKITNLQ